jgi:hypothetical protein
MTNIPAFGTFVSLSYEILANSEKINSNVWRQRIERKISLKFWFVVNVLWFDVVWIIIYLCSWWFVRHFSCFPETIETKGNSVNCWFEKTSHSFNQKALRWLWLKIV